PDPPTARLNFRPLPLRRTRLGEEDVFRSGLNAPPCRRRRPPLPTPPSPPLPDLLPSPLVYFYSVPVVWFYSALDNQLREHGAARVHSALFHPARQPKKVDFGHFQLKSFSLRPCVIMLIFNGLGWPSEILAGQ